MDRARIKTLTLLAALLLPLCVLSPARAAEPEANYDPEIDLREVDLGPARTSSELRAALRCHYYRGFMVKEVDLGEMGNARMSFLPAPPNNPPPCQRDPLPGEVEIPGDIWHGYFAGAIGRYAVFRADDTVNGAIGFAIFQVNGRAPIYVSATVGPLRFDHGPAGRLLLRFDRRHDADCSVPRLGAICARATAAATAAAPVASDLCTIGYEAARRFQARRYCEAEDDTSEKCVAAAFRNLPALTAMTSVLAIPTDVTLLGMTTRETVIGAPRLCWPRD